MAGFKRGGARGGASKKSSFAKKRAQPTSDNDERPSRASKKAKAEDEEEEGAVVVPKLRKDEEGNQYVALNTSGKRRATVSEFKGNVLVNIREYYTTDDGEVKPGRKGISLSIENYNALLAAAPLIESVLTKKDMQVARPDYNGDADLEKDVTVHEEEEMKSEEDDDVITKADDEDEG